MMTFRIRLQSLALLMTLGTHIEVEILVHGPVGKPLVHAFGQYLRDGVLKLDGRLICKVTSAEILEHGYLYRWWRFRVGRVVFGGYVGSMDE
jgi:hypothetical protein